MRQAFVANGKRLPVTTLVLPEHRVAAVTNPEKAGYLAVQLAVGKKKAAANKPLAGHLKKAKLEYQPQYLRELQIESAEEIVPGAEIDLASLIGEGDTVAVTATSKGKGFAGVVKRHGFAGGPKTHGQSDRHRAPGSIGQRTTPGRIYRGKRMAGRMGGDTITVQNLKVLEFNPTTKTLAISGPVPGVSGSLVKIQIIKRVERPVAETAPVAEATETKTE